MVYQDELSGRDAFERAIGPVAKEKMFVQLKKGSGLREKTGIFANQLGWFEGFVGIFLLFLYIFIM